MVSELWTEHFIGGGKLPAFSAYATATRNVPDDDRLISLGNSEKL